jgi:hypothetical protein
MESCSQIPHFLAKKSWKCYGRNAKTFTTKDKNLPHTIFLKSNGNTLF